MSNTSNQSRFSAGWLRTGVSAFALCAFAVLPAAAQEAPAEGETADAADELIIVTGIRRSLESAQNIKRDSDTFVDVIVASDIGALPDRSVSEALQRVPGVSISRFFGGNDTDRFSIEGTGALIRGLPQVRPEFNGRDTFTANNGRGLGFEDVPPELMSRVEVFKNQTADMIEGGIAGTVNLVTRVPFDAPGRVMSFTADSNYGDLRKEATPSASALYSDRWTTSIGEVGFLANISYSELLSRTEGLQINGFFQRGGGPQLPPNPANPGALENTRPLYDGGETTCAIDPVKTFTTQSGGTEQFQNPTGLPGEPCYFVPRAMNARVQDHDRTRNGLALAGQWESPDGQWLATLSYIRSDTEAAYTERVINTEENNSSWNLGPATARLQADGSVGPDSFLYDSSGTFTSGTFIDSIGWRTPPGLNQRINPIDANDGDWCGVQNCGQGGEYGIQTGAYTHAVETNNLVEDYGFNLKFNPTDRLAFNFDAQYVDATVDAIDFTVSNWFYAQQEIKLNGEDPAQVIFRAPGVTTDPNNPHPQSDTQAFLRDPASYWWASAMDHTEDSEGTEKAFRGDVSYEVGNTWLSKVRGGFRYADRDQTTRWSNFNWGNLSNSWNGELTWTDLYATDRTELVTFDNFFRGDIANPIPYGMRFPSLDMVRNYDYETVFGISAQGFARQCLDNPAPGSVAGVSAFCGSGQGNDFRQTIFRPRAGGLWSPLAYQTLNGQPVQYTLNDIYDPTTGALIARPQADNSLYLDSEIHKVSEETQALYAMAFFGGPDAEVAGVGVEGNVGVRWVRTTSASDGFTTYPLVVQPTDCSPGSDGQVLLSCVLTADQLSLLDGTVLPSSVENTFDHVLPSFNVKFNLAEDHYLRFAASKAIARPEIGLLRNYLVISANIQGLNAAGERISQRAGCQFDPNDPNNPPPATLPVECINASAQVEFDGRQGNPFLEPTEATQYDMSYEWYFSDVGSFTATVFRKDVEGFFGDGEIIRDITKNGVQAFAIAGAPVNQQSGTLQGFELAYQQTFDFLPGLLSGFGVQANYTFVDNKDITTTFLDPLNANSNVTEFGNELPLAGVSEDTYNLVGFYQKGPLEARIAYNWRSRYLLTPDDSSGTSGGAVFADDSGYMDASLFYSVTPKLRLGFQGVNLLNEETRTLIPAQTRDGYFGEFRSVQDTSRLFPRTWFVNDRRFSLTLRANF